MQSAQVWSRNIREDAAQAANNHQYSLIISDGAREELEYWSEHIVGDNGAPIWDPVHSVTLTVDVGAVGYGATAQATGALEGDGL